MTKRLVIIGGGPAGNSCSTYSAMLGADLATAGRKLSAIGIEGTDIDTARRALEEAAG